MRVCIIVEGCYPYVVGGVVELGTQPDQTISAY